ncbi:MAG: glycoside hydrolase family 3 protein [Bacteroidales bacterium]|nr:glycoside hydrolase family 3 protein [Bacteroidales bacterium]
MSKLNLSLYFAILVFVLFSSGCENQVRKDESGSNAYNFVATDTSWKSLSLREKIGQTMMIQSNYYFQTRENYPIDSFMKDYPVGGIFIASWHFPQNCPNRDSSFQYMLKCVQDYESASKFPLFISEDFERGVGLTYNQYTHLPSEMAIGAANDTTLAYNFGSSIARESKELGVNWLLHPVVDLNMNPLHSLVIERSISDDADRALPLLKQQVRGIQEQGTIATIKHFPGDGATIRDQHLITSANNLDMKTWESTFGKVFQGLINDGAASIMVGHLRFAAYQKDSINGVLPPATLSKELMTDLLKGKMGFKGVIISDALNMGGVAGYYKNQIETAVESFKAGVDVVLWPDLEYMDTVEARILRGEIPMERLDDAVSRVWALREKFNLLKKESSIFKKLTPEDKEFISNTGQAIADKAITLIKDVRKELPITPQRDTLLLLVNISHSNKTKEFSLTKKLLEEKGFKVDTLMHHLSFFDYGWRVNYFDKYSRIIVMFENKYFEPLGVSLFKDKEALSLWMVNVLPREKIIGISYSNPYYVSFYLETAPININAYSSDVFSQKAVVKALVGDMPFVGTSPVKLQHDILK